MDQLFSIKNDRVVIESIKLSDVDGDISLNGSLDITGALSASGDITINGAASISGPLVLNDNLHINGNITSALNIHNNVTINSDLSVENILTANTLHVKRIITENGPLSDYGNWESITESNLTGKGLSWQWGDGNLVQLVYRDGGRIWTGGNIDIHATSKYMIDNTPVLYESTLGSTITKSNLRQVGKLNTLSVLGDVEFGDFIVFNQHTKRIGIGTYTPSATISIVDSNIELNIGTQQNSAIIGTRTPTELSFITDNRTRMSINYNGDVTIGNSAASNTVRIFGTIYANDIITSGDTTRQQSIKFNKDKIGLVWGDNASLLNDSGKLISSQSLSITSGNSYYIGDVAVLDNTSLGESITSSKLTSVGELESLSVSGNVVFKSVVKMDKIKVSNINISDVITLNDSGLSYQNNLRLYARGQNVVFSDGTEIYIGEEQSVTRTNGKLFVDTNNPPAGVKFAVGGDVSFGNKRFTTGKTAPTIGTFSVGDICWNSEPTMGSFVGWVCLTAGSPGIWQTFGPIGR